MTFDTSEPPESPSFKDFLISQVLKIKDRLDVDSKEVTYHSLAIPDSLGENFDFILAGGQLLSQFHSRSIRSVKSIRFMNCSIKKEMVEKIIDSCPILMSFNLDGPVDNQTGSPLSIRSKNDYFILDLG